MGRHLIDRRGLRFGRLVVLAVKRRDGDTWAVCRCDCGTRQTVRMASVFGGTTKSCGCLRRELAARRAATGPRRTHGEGSRRASPEYRAWSSMRYRCENRRYPNFARYGGRGIRVCRRWRRFQAFLEDVGRRPSRLYSLDRWPNPDGDYKPGNVRWATAFEQRHNRGRAVA